MFLSRTEGRRNGNVAGDGGVMNGGSGVWVISALAILALLMLLEQYVPGSRGFLLEYSTVTFLAGVVVIAGCRAAVLFFFHRLDVYLRGRGQRGIFAVTRFMVIAGAIRAVLEIAWSLAYWFRWFPLPVFWHDFSPVVLNLADVILYLIYFYFFFRIRRRGGVAGEEVFTSVFLRGAALGVFILAMVIWPAYVCELGAGMAPEAFAWFYTVENAGFIRLPVALLLPMLLLFVIAARRRMKRGWPL